MKELSIFDEIKAKRYDEAIQRANELNYVSDKDSLQRKTVEHIFPELKESEDERMIKCITLLVNGLTDEHFIRCGASFDEIKAWLEKKGEQKSFARYKVGDTIYYDSFGRLVSFVIANIVEDGTDNPMYEDKDGNSVFQNDIVEQKPSGKVEPKFKVGDWIIKNDDSSINIDYSCCEITKVENGNYMIESIYGYKGYNTFETFEKDYHIWSIQDAKDGDVLCCKSGWTCIFKTLVNDETFSSYCFMDKTKWFCEKGSECHTLNEEFAKAYNGEIKPATKEQRDLLFQKMREGGYEWDVKKKELTKIENKSSWSEEDEKYSSYICAALDCYYRLREDRNNTNGQENLDKARNWLYNKLKTLRPQNSVTDEELAQAKKEAYNDALDKIEYHSGEPTFDDGWSAAIWYLKKKNAQPQNTWKPSKGQLECLGYAIEKAEKDWSPLTNNRIYLTLKALKEQLEKL